MDQGTLKIILFFNSLLANGQNKKKYVIAVFKQWL